MSWLNSSVVFVGSDVKDAAKIKSGDGQETGQRDAAEDFQIVAHGGLLTVSVTRLVMQLSRLMTVSCEPKGKGYEI